jgi:AcrR family transcriptional regulator
VSPRGVATLDLRPRLFEAADRVLERDGPTGLSSRAITAEAGTATGLLFRHFHDFDSFLVEFIVDRMSSVHLLASGFVERAGSGTVADNLTEAALALLPMASRLFEIVHARPSLVPQLVASRMAHGSAGLEEIEREFARYLDAERRLGRIAPDADIESIALALASTVHELSLRHTPGDPSLPERFRRLAATLTSEITS